MNVSAKYLVLALAPFLVLGGVAAQEAQPAEVAFVRMAHLSPNAPEVEVSMTNAEEGGQSLTPEEFSGLGYRDTTDYLEVPTGEYEVAIETPDGSLSETISFNTGEYYTVAAIGLIVPENLGEQTDEEDEGGFFSFFRNLFDTGADRDSLELRLVSYEDELPLAAVEAATDPAGGAATDPAAAPADPAAPAGSATDPLAAPAEVPQVAHVRLVHAAPGTAPVSLVQTAGEAAQDDGDVSIVEDLAFSDASPYSNLEPTEANSLEVRIEGSEAAILTLDDVSLISDEVYTLFVIGTPVEEAPLETLLLGGEPTQGAGTADNSDDAEGSAAGSGGSN